MPDPRRYQDAGAPLQVFDVTHHLSRYSSGVNAPSAPQLHAARYYVVAIVTFITSGVPSSRLHIIGCLLMTRTPGQSVPVTSPMNLPSCQTSTTCWPGMRACG